MTAPAMNRTVPYEQYQQVRRELQEERSWNAAILAALGNGHCDTGTRASAILTADTWRQEETKGIKAANGEMPIGKGYISARSGQSRDSVRRHMAQLVDMGLIEVRSERAQPEWKTAPDGTRVKEFHQNTYIRLPDGSPTAMLRRFARSSPPAPARGGLHEREAERNDAGQFRAMCQSCHSEGTLIERRTLVCTACGSVFDQHSPENQNGLHKPNLSMPQLAASIHTEAPTPPPAPPPEAPTDTQISGENNGHETPPNVEARSMPQVAAPIDGSIAVLDAGALHVARAGQIETHPANGSRPLAHMLEHAAKAGIDQLWLTPAWVEARGLPAAIELASHEHTFTTAATEAGWTLRPGGLARWISARRDRERGYDAVYVGLPGYDTDTELRTATDGRVMLEALTYFERATRQRYLGHPLRTSARILKTSNPGKPLAPLELPECAEDRRLEWEYAWMAAPSLEETDGRHVHAYDRNGAYLAVCSSLTVGAGKLYHAPAVPVVDAKKPGYWLARIEYKTEHPAGWLPDPFHDDKHPAGAFHWRTSQTMALALELGASIECREAWMWGQSQRPLERWYGRLKDARYALADKSKYPNREAAELAAGIVKSCYTRMVGRLTAHLATKDDGALYRPDIRHAIVAAARANMARTIRKCAAVERAPLLVATDALYFLSDSPDAVADCPAPLELSAQLGKWKVAGTWPAGEFCRPMWAPGATARTVIKATNERARV